MVEKKREKFLKLWKEHEKIVGEMPAPTQSSAQWGDKLAAFYRSEMTKYWNDLPESHEIAAQFLSKFPSDLWRDLSFAADVSQMAKGKQDAESGNARDKSSPLLPQNGAAAFSSASAWAEVVATTPPPSGAIHGLVEVTPDPNQKAQVCTWGWF